MNEPDNNVQTASPAEPKKRSRPAAEKPARTRRNYQAEHAALQMKVEIAVKLLTAKHGAAPNDPIVAAALELLS